MIRYMQLLLVTTTLAAQTFTGVITDSMCLMDHEMMQRSPDAKCILECVREDKNTKFVLFDGKHAYRLSDQETPAQFAARHVRVTVQLYEKTGIIKVDRIEPAQ